MRRNKTFKSQLRPAKPLIIDYSCDLVSRARARPGGPFIAEQSPATGQRVESGWNGRIKIR